MTMHQVKLAQFEGPLALLLELIEREKLDITQVSLATVADQYLERVRAMGGEAGAEELADFLLISSKLLMMKSRLLLPDLVWKDDEETDNLAEQLKIYKIYRDAARVLRSRISQKRFAFARPWRLPETVMFLPPKKVRPDDLRTALVNLAQTLARAFIVLPKAALAKVISLQEKIKSLQALLRQAKQFTFRDFTATANGRGEIVVSFLAILELYRRRELAAVQEAEEIIITVK